MKVKFLLFTYNLIPSMYSIYTLEEFYCENSN